MFVDLLKHQIKQARRSLMRHTNMVANIFITLMFIILFLNFSMFGLFIYDILGDVFPDKDPVMLFNSALLYYFVTMLILRFLMQPIPALTIRPYLFLPVKRSSLIHYLIVKSLFNVFNFLPLLLILPFAFKSMILNGQAITGICWVGTLLFLVLCNSLLVLFLSKKILTNPRLLLFLLLGLAALVLLQRNQIFSLFTLSSKIFGAVVSYPILILAAILLFGLLYALNFSFLRWRLYEKDLAVMSGRKSRDMTSFSFLSKFGRIGTYIALELKLLWRNKRTRALVIMAFCILPLGFFIYSTIPFEEDSYIRPPARLETTDRQQDGQVAVTVKVTTDSLPDPAHAVFIVGNQDNIGQWKPDKTPLFHRQDSCWSRTFYYPGGTEMKYKLTLGSWNNQALTPSGSVPDPSTLRVVNDTTLAHHVTAWMIPERPFVFDINLVYMGIFFTGIFILLYGQFFFSFSGSFIEMMASRKIDLQAYFRAKHYLMITGAIVCWALCAVYAIYNVKIVFLNTALLLYNIGINSYILLYMATLTRKKMDLSQGLFSQQGRGGIQMLMILPTLVVPIAIHMSIRAMGYPNLGFYILGAMGLAGILCHKILFNFFLALFARQKYAMITGFRHTGE